MRYKGLLLISLLMLLVSISHPGFRLGLPQPIRWVNTLYRAKIKRLFDLILGSLALCAVAPLICLTAIVVRLGLGSPVFFQQERVGYKGERIKIFKFRTMTDERDADGNLLPDEQRLKPLGVFLRRWSLDELPQFWNVVKGDLSLVGPRPLLTDYLTLYTPEQARRHEVKPGITGLAQINGRNAISWEDKFSWDVRYVDEASLALDMWILWKTAGKLVTPKALAKRDMPPPNDFMAPRFLPPKEV